VSGLRAVVFDWGGTLTAYHEVDLLDLWRVAARVLAPEREHDMADALAAAEREWWRRADDGGHETRRPSAPLSARSGWSRRRR
jgi:putative hydrolase of the HAD superfamily